MNEMSEERPAERSAPLESALEEIERAASDTDNDARLRALEQLHRALEDEVEQTAPPGR